MMYIITDYQKGKLIYFLKMVMINCKNKLSKKPLGDI